jgi:hypothetical protein
VPDVKWHLGGGTGNLQGVARWMRGELKQNHAAQNERSDMRHPVPDSPHKRAPFAERFD